MVQENLGLVWNVVRRFANRGYELEDLFQVGCIGLLKCIDNFNPEYDVKLSTYAVPMIMGEIKRFLRDDNYIKVSRSLKELAIKASKVREQLVKENGTEPCIEELASMLQVEKEEIILATEATREVESLYKTVYSGNGDELLLMDRIKSVEDESKTVVEQVVVENLIALLNPQEQKLIKLRFFEEKTQAEIGGLLGISQVQVSRMEKRILRFLREELKRD